METNSVESGYNLPEKKPRVPKKVLDKNDFLNLLVNQLKNQNPLEPQSNEEFISTMAQFNSLETLASVDKNIQYGQAMSLIDRMVTAQELNKEPVTGRVEKAGIVDGKVVVYVAGKEYSLSEVKEIKNQDPGQRPATGSDLIQAALMIGREVLISKDDGLIRGIVEKVGVNKGILQVFVSGVPYNVSAITEIKDPAAGTTAANNPENSQSGVVSSEGTAQGTG
ncbi:MAG: flagellar hook assembly protein FlgD [Desulfocucumaceae bacterium]